MLEKQKDQKSLEERISDFKEALLNDEIITEFDRVVFESIIEKVIVGGFDENGKKKIPISLLLYIKQDLRMK